VAALALQADLPPAVEDAIEAVDGAAPLEPRLLLAHGPARVLAVAQHEEVEVLQGAGALEGAMDRAQPREDAIDGLVGDRHHDRGTRFGGKLRRVRDRTVERRDREPVAPPDEREEAEHRRPEPDRYPAEQR